MRGAAPIVKEREPEEATGRRPGESTAMSGGRPAGIRTVAGRAVLLLITTTTAHAPLAAQELPLKEDLPGSGGFTCPRSDLPPGPSPQARAQAAELASNAARAVILGDLPRARALLDRAVALDATSVELLYNRGRVLEDLGEAEAAVADYCLVASSSSDGGFDDAEDRIDVLSEAAHGAVPEAAVRSAEEGLTAAEAGALERAAASFEEAVGDAPTWADAYYNRGVVHSRLGRHEEAMRDFHRYLELRPEAPDALAVSQRIGQLESLAVLGTPSPGTALALGVLFPGMGQFYSGRGVGGITVLSLAAGAVAAGFLVREVNVRCLEAVEPGAACPPGRVVSRETERPHLKPAIGAAAVVALLGAVEAYGTARSRRSLVREAAAGGDGPAVDGDRGPTLLGPSVVARGATLDVSLLRLSFR